MISLILFTSSAFAIEMGRPQGNFNRYETETQRQPAAQSCRWLDSRSLKINPKNSTFRYVMYQGRVNCNFNEYEVACLSYSGSRPSAYECAHSKDVTAN